MPLYNKGARVGTGDRWQVNRKLGEGQFAEVYEVRDMLEKDKDVRVRNIRCIDATVCFKLHRVFPSHGCSAL
jgi:hypothetical protein